MNIEVRNNLIFYSFIYCIITITLYFVVPRLLGLVLMDGIWYEIIGYWDDWAYLPDGTPYPIGGKLYRISHYFGVFVFLAIYLYALALITVYLKEGSK